MRMFQELGSVILMGFFQLRILYGFMSGTSPGAGPCFCPDSTQEGCSFSSSEIWCKLTSQSLLAPVDTHL